MKKSFYLSLVAVLATAFNVMALDHGSIVGVEEPMSLRYNDSPQGPLTDKKVDYKIVTVGAKTWIWTNFVNGTLLETTAFNASQLRYRTTSTPTPNTRTEEALRGRVPGTQQSFGMATSAFPTANSFYFSIYQAEGPNVATEAYETAIKSYNKTTQNSNDDADVTAPDLTCEYQNLSGTSVDLVFSVTETSGQYFYYIKDVANGIEQVLFWDSYKLTGLQPDTEYNLSVTAIDFSGNESETKVITFDTTPPASINSGIAKDIYFQIGSTATELTVFARPTTIPDVALARTITGAEIKLIEYGKGDVTLVEPAVPILEDWAGQTSYTYKMSHSFPIGTLVEINLGYLLGPCIPPVTAEEWSAVYENYVYINQFVTDGADKGKAIVHIIGENGISNIPNVNLDSPILYTQSEGLITINDNNTAQLYAVGGQIVANAVANTINTSALAKGIYILKVKDVVGNITTFKIAVK